MISVHLISRRVYVAAFILVLTLAVVLRFCGLTDCPVGLHYDEAANGILSSEIASGSKTPIFIPAYTGKEVLFFYWTALWMKLVGIGPLAPRLAAASMGVLTVAATVWAIYELLFDDSDARWIALMAGGMLAFSFWHLVLSRYGFRAISQPLLQALTVAALWRGLRASRPSQPAPGQSVWLAVAGLFCGLTAYTYLAARAFPFPLAVALLALLIADRAVIRARLLQLITFAGPAALVLAPLIHYWLTHPGSFMTHNQRGYTPAGTSVHPMHIAAANATGFNPDQNIIWFHLWFRNIFIDQLIVCFQDQCFHNRILKAKFKLVIFCPLHFFSIEVSFIFRQEKNRKSDLP